MWNKKQTEALEANYSELKSQLNQNPNDFDIKAQLAKCCLDLQRFKEAENLYKEIIKNEPEESKHYYYLGKVYSSQKLWKEALFQQELAIKYWTGHNWAYLEKAKCFFGLSKSKEAIVLLEGLLPKLSTSKYDSVLLLNIHRILLKEYAAINENDKALSSAQKLIELDPGDGLNYYYLGKLKMDSKLFSDAIEYFIKADKLLKKPYVNDKIAICYAFLNQKDEAMKVYENIPYSRMDDYIHQHYGRLLLDIGDYENAKKQLKMSILKKGTSKINSHFFLGKTYIKLGKYKNALRELERSNEVRKKEYGSDFINAVNEIENIKKKYTIDENEILEDYADFKYGIIKRFITERGFGFIEFDDKKEIFCHIKNFRYNSPKDGDKVKFEVIDGKKGLEAANVYLNK